MSFHLFLKHATFSKLMEIHFPHHVNDKEDKDESCVRSQVIYDRAYVFEVAALQCLFYRVTFAMSHGLIQITIATAIMLAWKRQKSWHSLGIC